MKKMLNFVQQNFSDLMKFKDLWNRDNDGDKKEQRSFLRCAIVATSLFLIFVIGRKQNLLFIVKKGVLNSIGVRLVRWNVR